VDRDFMGLACFGRHQTSERAVPVKFLAGAKSIIAILRGFRKIAPHFYGSPAFFKKAGGEFLSFVIYGESGLYALEVKNTRKVRPEDLVALKSFAEDYPESRRFLLYRGSELLMRNGISCIPCDKFLRALMPRSIPFSDFNPLKNKF